VLNEIDDDRLAIHVVWTPVLASDRETSVDEARKIFEGDDRVEQYWDGGQWLGKAYGRIMELPRGRDLAWDIYFIFDDGVTWADSLPPPTDWQHQLGMDDRYLNGARLRESVRQRLHK
jgi:hypothetical protein